MPSQLVGVVFGVKIIEEPYFTNVTDIFGFRPWRKKRYPKSSGQHNGIDLGTKGTIGIAIRSPYDGTVVQVAPNVAKAGNILKIRHDDGFETRYLHLDSFSVILNEKVKAGQVVAKSGNTDGGSSHSTGPHLHFEVIVDGKAVDPAPYLYGYTLEDGVGKKFKPSLTGAFDKKAKVDNTDILKVVNSKQLDFASIIVNVCKQVGGSKRDAIIAIETALVESQLQNLNYGDRDSQGLFQQRPSQGWGSIAQITNPEYAAKAFFTGTSAGNKGLLDYKNRESISTGKAAQQVQRSAYPDKYDKVEDKATQIVNFLWGDIVNSFLDESATEILENEREEVEIDSYLAPGIWQIIKTVIDPEVSKLQINDATISFMQGSLLNFVDKVCQKPFVEFWGDTYGDQYYFIIRKPPFTRQSFLSLPMVKIDEGDVFSDSLGYETEACYSWYSLEPNGNYIGGDEVIFQYLQAVFFTEYAEIWGSKPLSITTNYITFIKENGDVQVKQAEQDLKFIIDCNSYLPFTRRGSITIRGDRRIKRGMKILYSPTDEYYYVDSVSNNFSAQDGMLERTTTLSVSRGMSTFHADIEIEDKYTASYFNLINYGPGQYIDKPAAPPQAPESKPANPNVERHLCYFNQDKYVFNYDDISSGNGLIINSGNISLGAGSNTDPDKELLITKAIVDANFAACTKAADYCNQYPNLSFEIVGNTDAVDSNTYNILLGKRRANTVKAIIIQAYVEKYKPDSNTLVTLENRLIIRTQGEAKPDSDNKSPLGRLKNRRVDFYVAGDFDKEQGKEKKPINKKQETAQGNKWSVNREVFMFFLRRNNFNGAFRKSAK